MVKIHYNITANLMRSTFYAINHGIYYGGGPRQTCTIFGGTQPSADTFITDWNTYKTQYLLHFQDYTIKQVNDSRSLPARMELNQLPPSAVAANTDTATWAVLWPNNVSSSSLSGSIINTYFAIVPVTNLAGNGVIRLSSANIINGNTYTLDVFNIAYTGGDS